MLGEQRWLPMQHLRKLKCPTNRKRVGVCSGTTNGHQCTAFGGACTNGKLAATDLRLQDNHCGTCNSNLYLSNRACKTCSNINCAANQYRTGACLGATDGFKCNKQPVCKADQFEYLSGATSRQKGACLAQPVCPSGQYLTGHAARAKGKCASQPACANDQYLAGSGPTARGKCTACANTACAQNLFRAGTCSGTTNAYKCNTCSNLACPLNHYRAGACSGTTDGFTCKACANVKCGAMEGSQQYQTGSCSGTTNAFKCNTCSNIKCAKGKFRSGACSGEYYPPL